MTTNPLQKYFRQPKIFVSLPSQGLYYPDGSLSGDHTNVPVFAMTGMDELIMKTPDALFSGEATVKLLESCCPYITNGKDVPSFDIDVLLVAIRIATFGPKMTVTHTCRHCETENDFDIDLGTVLDNYKDKRFENVIELDDLTIRFKPLSYSEMTKFNVESFKFQKMLSQVETVSDDERQKFIDSIYENLATLQVDIFLSSIESISGPEFTVTERDHIREWLSNSNRESYAKIKQQLEKNKDSWAIPKHQISCANCNTVDQIDVAMDQSNFFE
jgi:hypothetical protein